MRIVFVVALCVLSLFVVNSPAFASKERLTIANSKAWKPYSYLDDQGEPTGILIDIWKAYGIENGIEVEFKLVDWNDSLELVRNGEADIHAGLLWSKQRSAYLSYGPEIVKLDTQLYMNRKLADTNVTSILIGKDSHVIGAVKGAYEMEFMQAQYPDATLKPYNNNQLMLEAAFRGDIDVFIADLLVANYYLQAAGMQMDFFPSRLLYSGELHFASSINNVQTLSEVTDKYEKIADDDKRRIFAKWMHIETVYPKYLFAGLLVLVCFVLVGYTVSLRFAVKVKTQQLAQANRELSYLAKIDSLTGIYNRRSFTTMLDEYQKVDSSLTVMVLDIDDFKYINDHFGHAAGDDVICAVADKIKELASKGIAARIGGEEFAVVLSNIDRDASYQIAEAIVREVNQQTIPSLGEQRISISLGCAFYASSKAYTSLVEADKLMYQAKAQGKGVVIANEI